MLTKTIIAFCYIFLTLSFYHQLSKMKDLPIPTIIERKFHLTTEESLTYRLPIFSESNIENDSQYGQEHIHGQNRLKYILIGSPVGADINNDGILHWHPRSILNQKKKSEVEREEDMIEYFIVKVTGNCDDETALIEISVHISSKTSKASDKSR